ncbi:MAG: hypothetical protein M1816_006257 [Peltula sp. TS41687]|nr:MAG: hypothetical protein M1816_006257 [Peltula sp. TS41687]
MSEPFNVFPAKAFPGMSESTFISRSFGDQGVRLRIRKEPRTLLKRPPPPGIRPEDYPLRPGDYQPQPPTYPPPMGSDPRQSFAGVGPGQLQGGYGALPVREYSSYGEPPKRQRTSIDLTPRYMYEGDTRGYGQQPQTYGAYPQQSPSFQTYPMMPSHGQPPPTSDFTFRPPQASTTPSPYVSPGGSQRTQISPLAASPGYQPQTRYFQQHIISPANAPSPSAQISNLPELTSLHQRSQLFQTPVAPSPLSISTNTTPLSSTMLSRPLSGQENYPSGNLGSAGNPLHFPMPPPPPGVPRPHPSQYQLPPLHSTASSNILAAAAGLGPPDRSRSPAARTTSIGTGVEEGQTTQQQIGLPPSFGQQTQTSLPPSFDPSEGSVHSSSSSGPA